ncbi:MAG TPA: ATP phosphoribosyltransferase [Gaiellaceae bacterium]|nr:ATP phosphoribosyltransferase [Gaiellaceae bacterium]
MPAPRHLPTSTPAQASLTEALDGRLARLRPPAPRPAIRVAVPAKGRLHDPSISLLDDAGLGPEAAADRAYAFPCRNAPVEVLLVRASDIPEYVQDGVVDGGITGLDLVHERGARVDEVARLAYGSCRLEVAVPEESPIGSVDELAGARVATAHPRLTRTLLAERGVAVTTVPLTGSVEVAPRLALAEAITDLVSSGETLRRNGLQSIGSLFSSEAVLIAPPGRAGRIERLADVLRSVVDARAARYFVFNVPADSLEDAAEVLDRYAWGALPLANSDAAAVHVVIPAADVWTTLPELKQRGASSLGVLPLARDARRG